MAAATSAVVEPAAEHGHSLKGDELEACLMLLPLATLLSCRRVSTAWHAAVSKVVSSEGWQAQIPLATLLEQSAPTAAIQARLAAAPWEAHLLDRAGRTFVHVAILRRVPPATLLILLQAYPEAAHIVGPGKMLPLHAAASVGAIPEVMAAVIGANPEAARSPSKGHRLPLHHGALCHTIPLSSMETLLRANPAAAMAKACDGCLPLHLAAGSSRAIPEIVTLLLAAAPDSARKRGREEMLPLHLAAHAGAPSLIIRLLLKAYPEGIRVPDQSGALPLHRAVEARAPAVLIKLLMEAYPLDASTWSLAQLLRLGKAGEHMVLDKIAADPSHVLRDEASGRCAVDLAIYYNASPHVVQALLDVTPAVANVYGILEQLECMMPVDDNVE